MKEKADQVISNNGSFEDTWQKVYAAWLNKFPEEEEISTDQASVVGEWIVQKGAPAPV